MPRRSRMMLVLCAILLPLAACTSGQMSGPEVVRSPEIDAAFLRTAATYGLDEVTYARLASTRANDAAVRAYAAQVVRERGPIDQQLAALGQSKGIAPPTAMDPQHQVEYHQLEGLSGIAFDHAYIDRQMQMQTMGIQAFQREVDRGADPRLRDFAEKTLPVLQNSLRATVQLKSQAY